MPVKGLKLIVSLVGLFYVWEIIINAPFSQNVSPRGGSITDFTVASSKLNSLHEVQYFLYQILSWLSNNMNRRSVSTFSWDLISIHFSLQRQFNLEGTVFHYATFIYGNNSADRIFSLDFIIIPHRHSTNSLPWHVFFCRFGMYPRLHGCGVVGHCSHGSPHAMPMVAQHRCFVHDTPGSWPRHMLSDRSV